MKEFWTFFAFPLNLLVAVLLLLSLVWLRKSCSNTAIIRFFHSPIATISAIGLLAVSGLWIGFTGDRSFVESIFFVIVVLYVQIVLFLVTLRGWRSGGAIRWRFLLLHLGLLLAIGSGFWGAPDSDEYRMRIYIDQTSREAFTLDAKKVILPYEISLYELETEYSDDGKPIHYEALVSVNGCDPVALTVNHPYSLKFGQDIYLASVSDDSCVLQIVREPWRYFALSGIVMMLAGAFLLFINGPRR